MLVSLSMEKPDIPDFFIDPRNIKNSFDPDKLIAKYKYFFILILFLFLFVPQMLVLVQAGHKAVIFNRLTGMEKRVLSEGVQIVIPFVEEVADYQVREFSYIFSNKPERSREAARIMGPSISTLTSDGQNITVDVTVRARPDFDQLWWLHQNLGKDKFNSYIEKILAPVTRSLVRQIIAGYTVSAIYSEDRRAIADKISKFLAQELVDYKIVLTEFLLDEVTFSDAYQNSIEQKQQARIELDTKDNIIIEEKNKRDAVITRAQGEAEAIRLRVESLTRNPAYLKFRRAQILGKRAKLVIDDKL
jgi:prohibitin 2